MFQAQARTNEISGTAMSEGAPRRVLAIDYGRRRIGLALSDELGLTAQPLTTLVRTNRRSDLGRLRDLCRQHGVAQVVVGCPLNLNGQAGPMAEEATRFAARLRKELGIAVDLQDERLTSWEAEQMARETRLEREPLDHVAAAIVLRDYLGRQRGGPSARAKKD
jgi:putative holliday junction resolvase